MDNGASSYRRFLNGDESGLEDIVKMYNNLGADLKRIE